MIKIGDTFSLNGERWCIKLIDLTGKHPKNKSGEPRIDASRFEINANGIETLRKGRPSKFKPQDVFDAMGIKMPEVVDEGGGVGFNFYQPPAAAAIPVAESVDNVERDWEQVRVSRERVRELLGKLDDDSTEEDWYA